MTAKARGEKVTHQVERVAFVVYVIQHHVNPLCLVTKAGMEHERVVGPFGSIMSQEW